MTIDRAEVLLSLTREAGQNALTFVEGLTLEEFQADTLRRYAVAMCLVVIGENVGRLVRDQPDFVAAHPEVPWSRVIGMRNRIAHGYDELDFEIVWRTVTESLPEFLRTLPAPEPPLAD